MPGGRGAGGGGRGRADRHRDRDPIGQGREHSPGPPRCSASIGRRLFALAEDMGLALARDRDPPVGRTTSTSRSSTRPTTSGSAPTSAGSPSATTPGASTSTSECEAPTGRSPSATRCASCCRCCSRPRPTRPSSTARTPACTRCAPRSSPAPSRAAASTSRSGTGTPTPISSSLLERTASIVEATQLWWSVRPHHRFGTVEVRICDAQTSGDESFGLLACWPPASPSWRSTTTRGGSGSRAPAS